MRAKVKVIGMMPAHPGWWYVCSPKDEEPFARPILGWALVQREEDIGPYLIPLEGPLGGFLPDYLFFDGGDPPSGPFVQARSAEEAIERACGASRFRPEDLEKPVDALDGSVRVRRLFKALDLKTVGDVVRLCEHQILGAPGVGPTTLNVLVHRLGERGLRLRSCRCGLPDR